MDCANICKGSPSSSCKAWSYRDEPIRSKKCLALLAPTGALIAMMCYYVYHIWQIFEFAPSPIVGKSDFPPGN